MQIYIIEFGLGCLHFLSFYRALLNFKMLWSFIVIGDYCLLQIRLRCSKVKVVTAKIRLSSSQSD